MQPIKYIEYCYIELIIGYYFRLKENEEINWLLQKIFLKA